MMSPRNRPLSNIYPIVYLDAIHFKVRDNGKIVSKAAKDWRAWAKLKLSSPCASRSGGHNSSGYPGRCSGNLERSLHYRTYHTIRGRSPNYQVVGGWISEFNPFTNSDGIDYGEKLDRTFMPYKGYKKRIYEAMDSFLLKAISRHSFSPFKLGG